MWAWNSLEQLWQDLRYALRLMRRSPGFTAVAILSLALGIGANTAIFSLMYTVMLRLLPVTHPEQLVELLHRLPREGHRGNSFTWQAWQDLRDHNHVLAALIAASPMSHQLLLTCYGYWNPDILAKGICPDPGTAFGSLGFI